MSTTPSVPSTPPPHAIAVDNKLDYEPVRQSEALTHFPALDGVRGIAVLMVVLIHTFVLQNTTGVVLWLTKFAAIGWMGVDLFFVLSGFLITSILLRTRPTFTDARNFVIRRALRTWPLYYAVLLLALFVLRSTSIYASTGLNDAYRNQWWFYLHASNLLFSLRQSWSADCISHFWSLAVEEQFYLIWPFVVLSFRGKLVPWACAGLIVLAVGTKCVLLWNDAGILPMFASTPAKADALAFGSLAAWWNFRYGPGYRKWAACLLVGAVTYAIGYSVYFGEYPPFKPFHAYALWSVELAFACWIYLMLTPVPVLTAVLSRGVLPFFGKYSYGIYVLHQFFHPLFDHFCSPRWLALQVGSKSVASVMYFSIVLSVSTLAAVVSYHLFEAQFLKLKDRFR